MKLLRNIVLAATFLYSSTGFSGQCISRNNGLRDSGDVDHGNQDSGAVEKEELNLLDLPDDVLGHIFKALGKVDLGGIASCNGAMRHLAQQAISDLDDGVKLEQGAWMRLRTALDGNKISEITEIKCLYSLFRSSEDLRICFVKAITRELDQIASDSSLSLDQKQERRDVFHRHVLALGVMPSRATSRFSAESLADVILSELVWKEVGIQVREQLEVLLENRVRKQLMYQIGYQGRRLFEDNVSHQYRHQVRGQFEAQVGAQLRRKVGEKVENITMRRLKRPFSDRVSKKILTIVRSEVAKSIGENLNFAEQGCESKLQSAIDHTFLVFQLSSFVMMQSPEFELVRTNLSEKIKEVTRPEKIEKIIKELDIPLCDDPKINAFLDLIRWAYGDLGQEKPSL